MREDTDLLQDAEAQQFYAVASAIRAKQPRIAILENVVGLKRVLQKVVDHLKSMGPYEVVVLEVDPSRLGLDVSRPRLYIIMWHVSVLADINRGETLKKNAQACLASAEAALSKGRKRKWEDALFGEESNLVKAWRKAQ